MEIKKNIYETRQEFYEMRAAHNKKMKDELLRVQIEADDRGYEYAGYTDFNYSKFWFGVETMASDDCRVLQHNFACKSISDLKEAITWIINETEFYKVTAFVKDSSFVTFCSQNDIDLYFDSYYGDR